MPQIPGFDATSQSHQLSSAWLVFTIVGLFVGVVIYGSIFWCLLRYRQREGREAADFKRNTPLELTYVIAPLLIVIGLFVFTFGIERRVEALAALPDVSVNVTGFKWSWQFRYPAYAITVVGTPQAAPELVLPVDKIARINLASSDVDHAFWVPQFLFKRDAIPGSVNRFDLNPVKLGLYRGQCAEFCGIDHAFMTFNVRVVSSADWKRWLAQRRKQS